MKKSDLDYVSRLIYEHKEKEAIAFLKKMPNDNKALLFLADIYYSLGKYLDALNVIKQNIIELEKFDLPATISYQRDIFIQTNKIEEIKELYSKYHEYPYHSQVVEEIVNDLPKIYDRMLDEILHKKERTDAKEKQILNKLLHFEYDLEVDQLLGYTKWKKTLTKTYLKLFKEYLLQDDDIVLPPIKNIIVMCLYKRNLIENDIDYNDGSKVIKITKKYLDNLIQFANLAIIEAHSYPDNITYVAISDDILDNLIKAIIPYDLRAIFRTPKILGACLINLSASFFDNLELEHIANFYQVNKKIVLEKTEVIRKYLYCYEKSF